MKRLVPAILVGIMLTWLFLPVYIVIKDAHDKAAINSNLIEACTKDRPLDWCKRNIHYYAPTARDHL